MYIMLVIKLMQQFADCDMSGQQKYKAEENTQTTDLAVPIIWKIF